MRNLQILFIFIFVFSPLKASEVSEWFEKESSQFLEIINNNEGTESENYDKYRYFISKNFATKSIAYGLIGESVINKSTEDELSLYLEVFTDYLIKTIYKRARARGVVGGKLKVFVRNGVHTRVSFIVVTSSLIESPTPLLAIQLLQ